MTTSQGSLSSSTAAAASGRRWAWGIGLLYAGFVAGMLGMVFFCTTQRVELVRDDYYQAGVDHQGRINAEGRAMTLGSELPTVSTDASTGDLLIAVPGGADNGSVTLYRPADSSLDFSLPLALQQGVMRVAAGSLKSGHWLIELDWRAGGRALAVDLPYHAGHSGR